MTFLSYIFVHSPSFVPITIIPVFYVANAIPTDLKPFDIVNPTYRAPWPTGTNKPSYQEWKRSHHSPSKSLALRNSKANPFPDGIYDAKMASLLNLTHLSKPHTISLHIVQTNLGMRNALGPGR